jgi:hypothetical protein
MYVQGAELVTTFHNNYVPPLLIMCVCTLYVRFQPNYAAFGVLCGVNVQIMYTAYIIMYAGFYPIY